MTFMVVDTDSHDVLLGVDLLIKIGAIVDVEQGLIQIRHGPGIDVEVLPLTMVNLMQRSDLRANDRDDDGTQKHVPGNLDATDELSSLYHTGTSEQIVERESEFDSSSSEDSDERTQPNKADDFMKEEVTDADDYVDRIQWAADAEQHKQNLSEVANAREKSVLLQIQQKEITHLSSDVKERIIRNPKEDTRCGEICQKIRIDQHLDKGMERQLWNVLERYQDVFAWNKAERVLAVRYGQHLDWLGHRRQLRGLIEHRGCCFGINHKRYLDLHHLFMIDIVTVTNADEETTTSVEVVGATANEGLEVADVEQKPQKGQIRYYN
ncbi:unnamed protein product [Sphagnum tenellum]